MPAWRFLITPEAEEDLAKLDSSVQKRVIQKLEWFVEHFEDVSPVPLAGNWSGFFKDPGIGVLSTKSSRNTRE